MFIIVVVVLLLLITIPVAVFALQIVTGGTTLKLADDQAKEDAQFERKKKMKPSKFAGGGLLMNRKRSQAVTKDGEPAQKSTSSSSAAVNPSIGDGRIFATPLSNDPKNVPKFLLSAMDYLGKHGSQIEGLFRISGDAGKIKLLRARIDDGDSDIKYEEHGVHEVSGIIKLYFREMPEPLLTFEYYDMFLATGTIPVEQSRIDCVKKVLTYLPQSNYILLQALCTLLHKISLNSTVNKMTASNLAIIFVPNLIKAQNENAQNMLDDMSKKMQLVTLLITEANILFPSTIGEEPSSSAPESDADELDDSNENEISAIEEHATTIADVTRNIRALSVRLSVCPNLDKLRARINVQNQAPPASSKQTSPPGEVTLDIPNIAVPVKSTAETPAKQSQQKLSTSVSSQDKDKDDTPSDGSESGESESDDDLDGPDFEADEDNDVDDDEGSDDGGDEAQSSDTGSEDTTGDEGNFNAEDSKLLMKLESISQVEADKSLEAVQAELAIVRRKLLAAVTTKKRNPQVIDDLKQELARFNFDSLKDKKVGQVYKSEMRTFLSRIKCDAYVLQVMKQFVTSKWALYREVLTKHVQEPLESIFTLIKITNEQNLDPKLQQIPILFPFEKDNFAHSLRNFTLKEKLKLQSQTSNSSSSAPQGQSETVPPVTTSASEEGILDLLVDMWEIGRIVFEIKRIPYAKTRMGKSVLLRLHKIIEIMRKLFTAIVIKTNTEEADSEKRRFTDLQRYIVEMDTLLQSKDQIERDSIWYKDNIPKLMHCILAIQRTSEMGLSMDYTKCVPLEEDTVKSAQKHIVKHLMRVKRDIEKQKRRIQERFSKIGLERGNYASENGLSVLYQTVYNMLSQQLLISAASSDPKERDIAGGMPEKQQEKVLHELQQAKEKSAKKRAQALEELRTRDKLLLQRLKEAADETRRTAYSKFLDSNRLRTMEEGKFEYKEFLACDNFDEIHKGRVVSFAGIDAALLSKHFISQKVGSTRWDASIAPVIKMDADWKKATKVFTQLEKKVLKKHGVPEIASVFYGFCPTGEDDLIRYCHERTLSTPIPTDNQTGKVLLERQDQKYNGIALIGGWRKLCFEKKVERKSLWEGQTPSDGSKVTMVVEELWPCVSISFVALDQEYAVWVEGNCSLSKVNFKDVSPKGLFL